MKKTNGQRGITLIALVVTIVVLLILAGVTITYVLNDGGIFAKSREAAVKTVLSGIRDYANNAQGEYMMRYYGGDLAEGASPTITAGSIVSSNFPYDVSFDDDDGTPSAGGKLNGTISIPAATTGLDDVTTVTFKKGFITVTCGDVTLGDVASATT